jgi:hypothetical protein
MAPWRIQGEPQKVTETVGEGLTCEYCLPYSDTHRKPTMAWSRPRGAS